MKKVVVVLVLLISILDIGQIYCKTRLIDNSKNKLWYVISGELSFNKTKIDTCCLESEVLKIGENITLNNKLYSTLYKSNDIFLTNWKLVGYIRDENNKTYYMPVSHNSEYLLYDFNLELASKIRIINPLFGTSDTTEYTVSKIDYITLDNSTRKRITLSSKNQQQEVWIEGIGSLNGLIYSGLLIDGGFKNLTCFFENDHHVYNDPNYKYCFYNSTESIETDKNNTSISMNYVNSIITLNNMNNSTFYFYNLSGILLFQKTIDNDTYTIDISNLQKGIYIYLIQKNDSFIRKIVLKY